MVWVINVSTQPLYPRERDLVPILQEAGWAPRPVWTGAENIVSPEFNPRTVQPVTSCCTDYAVPTHHYYYYYYY